MMKRIALGTLAAMQVVTIALALFLHSSARHSILAAYADARETIPPATRIATSDWFLPTALSLSIAVTVIGLAALKPTKRLAVLATGVTVLAVAVMFAAWAYYVPLFGLYAS